jgi:hypothetical protein
MSTNNVPRQLGAILDVLGLDSTSLYGEKNQDAGKNRDKVVAWLYRILDTLDNKTGHVRGFAALLLTAQTLLTGLLVGNKQTPTPLAIFALVLLLFPLMAGLLSLPVFNVQWRFFGYVRGDSNQKASEDQIKKELADLAMVCDRRVQTHKRTSIACFCSAIAFGVTLLLTVIVFICFRNA